MDGTSITPATATCDLGLVMDSHLKLTNHINNICTSASLVIRNIRRLRKFLSQADCDKLVHAFVIYI